MGRFDCCILGVMIGWGLGPCELCAWISGGSVLFGCCSNTRCVVYGKLRVCRRAHGAVTSRLRSPTLEYDSRVNRTHVSLPSVFTRHGRAAEREGKTQNKQYRPVHKKPTPARVPQNSRRRDIPKVSALGISRRGQLPPRAAPAPAQLRAAGSRFSISRRERGGRGVRGELVAVDPCQRGGGWQPRPRRHDLHVRTLLGTGSGR